MESTLVFGNSPSNERLNHQSVDGHGDVFQRCFCNASNSDLDEFHHDNLISTFSTQTSHIYIPVESPLYKFGIICRIHPNIPPSQFHTFAITLPKTNEGPLKRGHFTRTGSFFHFFFRGNMLLVVFRSFFPFLFGIRNFHVSPSGCWSRNCINYKNSWSSHWPRMRRTDLAPGGISCGSSSRGRTERPHPPT